MLIHVVFYLGNTEKNTEKSPNIIQDDQTANKCFTAEYIFFREKVRENKVSELFKQQEMTFKIKRGKQGNN